MVGMQSHSTLASVRPCWHCTAYAGLTGQGTVAICTRPGCCRARSDPAIGCVRWEREPGSDDEAGPPQGYRNSDADWRSMCVHG